MQALYYKTYGSPDVLQTRELEKPTPREGEVLVKVHATTVNRTDCAIIRAKPFFIRVITGLLHPKKSIPGTALAGEVQILGRGILTFKPGDKVFGFDDEGAESHAQYLVIKVENILTMPDKITYAQAAASVEGAHYAYNFINKVVIKQGQKMLVNGASGAIGSAAVQLLKNYGIHITAVCSSKNIDLARSLGADRILDYTKQDFTKQNEQYDFVFDTVGKSSFFKCSRILKPGGIYISSDLGYMWQNIYLPLITPVIKSLISNKKTISPFPSNIRATLLLLKSLMEQGRFKAVIDRNYPFAQIIDAYRYVEKGEKTGNVIISMEQ